VDVCLVVVENDDISIAGFRSVGKHAIADIVALLEKQQYRNSTKYLLIEEYFHGDSNTITIFLENYKSNELVDSS